MVRLKPPGRKAADGVSAEVMFRIRPGDTFIWIGALTAPLLAAGADVVLVFAREVDVDAFFEGSPPEKPPAAEPVQPPKADIADANGRDPSAIQKPKVLRARQAKPPTQAASPSAAGPCGLLEKLKLALDEASESLDAALGLIEAGTDDTQGEGVGRERRSYPRSLDYSDRMWPAATILPSADGTWQPTAEQPGDEGVDASLLQIEESDGSLVDVVAWETMGNAGIWWLRWVARPTWVNGASNLATARASPSGLSEDRGSISSMRRWRSAS